MLVDHLEQFQEIFLIDRALVAIKLEAAYLNCFTLSQRLIKTFALFSDIHKKFVIRISFSVATHSPQHHKFSSGNYLFSELFAIGFGGTSLC